VNISDTTHVSALRGIEFEVVALDISKSWNLSLYFPDDRTDTSVNMKNMDGIEFVSNSR
jgi:hypothetical protein